MNKNEDFIVNEGAPVSAAGIQGNSDNSNSSDSQVTSESYSSSMSSCKVSAKNSSYVSKNGVDYLNNLSKDNSKKTSICGSF